MNSHKNGLILPKENNAVKSNTTFDANGHDYVEIAGIKWATMNVGAKSITDYGLYFAWGDTQGYTAEQVTGATKEKEFNWGNYKFTTDGGNTFTKYNSTDGKTVLDLDDDAVNAAWGGFWRMPTMEEFKALCDAVTNGTVVKQLTTKDGIYGLLLTEGDKELFFPACGNADNGSMFSVGRYGYYWSSLLVSSSVNNAYYLNFYNGYVNWQSNDDRYYGFAVRGVLDEKFSVK